jgi:hypothetical protein
VLASKFVVKALFLHVCHYLLLSKNYLPFSSFTFTQLMTILKHKLEALQQLTGLFFFLLSFIGAYKAWFIMTGLLYISLTVFLAFHKVCQPHLFLGSLLGMLRFNKFARLIFHLIPLLQ